MRIFSINYPTEYCGGKNLGFKGSPQRIPSMTIKNYQDALKFWENLRYAKYLDAHNNTYYDKTIRADNYSFLDKLTSYTDKAGFVEKYCEFTNFPKLHSICSKINSTFKTCIDKLSKTLNVEDGYSSNYDIIDYGYDPICSLGLEKAFPGSDLDKGYVILRGTSFNSPYFDKKIVDNFKTKLWDDLDQRIVSLNHKDNDISVYTTNQVEDTLRYLDNKVDDLKRKTFTKKLMRFALIAASMTNIYTMPAAAFYLKKYYYDKFFSVDPYIGGEFNRDLAKIINDRERREEAKNFAFFIETVRANMEKSSYGKNHPIFSKIKNSAFAQNSNVTQTNAWQNKIDNGYMKSKLRNREKLESDFYSMTTDTKYDLIKDVIKYATDDQSSRFSEYFKNDDDIANRYDKLLQSLK